MDEIRRLIERRHVKAVLDKVTLKLMTVAEHLGKPIMSEGPAAIFPTVVPEWGAEEEDIRSWDGESNRLGYIYDSLHLGQNLEVRWLETDAELRATYDGHVVYHEVEGELQAYVPRPDWEALMDHLYQQAKQVAESRTAEAKEKERGRLLRQAGEFVQNLRSTWGF